MSRYTLLLLLILVACQPQRDWSIDQTVLASLGSKHQADWHELAKTYEVEIQADSSKSAAMLSYAETMVIIHIFGYAPRSETLPQARTAYAHASMFDSTSSARLKMKGILEFLDWKWAESGTSFSRAIEADSANLSARHWYSLWLSAMGRFEEAMEQSDKILEMDANGDFMIGRGSMFYFARRFEEMKALMQEVVTNDPDVAWGYDWLGMAYIELEEYDNSIETYFKAFELSDGTVEVGAGLGHALAQAGEIELAKEMADYYTEASKNKYLPPVQRSFIHIGLKEYETALQLLEQAFAERSWFLIFIQIEPWYDPIRQDPAQNERFQAIVDQMQFPPLR